MTASLLAGIPTLDDLFVEHPNGDARVLVRADLNVPLADGTITDDLRIRASLSTLRELIERRHPVVVCAHLGRPGGRPDLRLSLVPVATRLADLLGAQVQMGTGVVDDPTRTLAAELSPGEVLLVENLRFDPGETANDDDFARALASLADVFVQDAFGAVHRAHASVEAVTKHLPSHAGRLLQVELVELGALLVDPPRPLLAILGGAKVSDKLTVLERLADHVDTIAVGGAMCFTFLAAAGHDVGVSRVELDQVDNVRRLVAQATQRGVTMLLPTDVVVAPEFHADAPATIVAVDEIPSNQMGLDVGPATAAAYGAAVAQAGAVFWNGPMGVFEWPAFAAGTRAVAASLAASDAHTIIGGGDSAAACRLFGFDHDVTHVSTGGGASLELLEGKDLPGVAALRRPDRHQ